MQNFLKWGATSLYKTTAECVDEDLTIGMTGREKLPITGALVNSVPLLDPARVKMTAERFIFLIDTLLLAETGLKMERGIEITRVINGNVYEVVLDPKGASYNNDTEQMRTAIICTKKAI